MCARALLLLPILAAGCVLTSPGHAVTKSDPAFKLSQLTREPVAVWPVATAAIDPAAIEGVTDGYGSQDAFLDSVARTVSGRLVRPGGPASLRSDDVVARLGASDATRPLLDAKRLLGGGTESRFSARSQDLATLGSQPALEGIRYAVLFPELAVNLQQTVTGTSTTGTSTVKWARGKLHGAVVDLRAGKVVWEGDLAASGKLSGGGMKQIDEGFGAALDEAMEVAPPPGAPGAPAAPPGTARCETTADCERGVCISGACR